MAGGDVANLMPNHARQVGLALHIGHDAACDIHITTGQCKGIDDRAVEHRKVPLQAGAVRLRGQLLAQRIHIGLHGGVVVHTVFLEHLLVALGALGQFGLLAHHRALGLAGNGVDHGGAATGQ